jgi:hypothetical protein
MGRIFPKEKSLKPNEIIILNVSCFIKHEHFKYLVSEAF